MRVVALLGISLLGLAGCSNVGTKAVPLLATGRMTSDFESYTLRRVAVLPLEADSIEFVGDESLKDALYAEFVAATDYEVVPLDARDLLEMQGLEPLRRGHYSAETLLELRRRFRLDAIAVGSILTRRAVPPQRLGVQFDLLSCETGATLWSASVMLDAADARTREALEAWSVEHSDSRAGAELILLSPRNFARFAAWQLMQLL